MSELQKWPGISGRTAIVVGGGGGIGAAIVGTLAKSGATVAVVDPSSGDVAEAHIRIRSRIQNDEAAREIVQQVVGQLGPVGIVVFAAGRVGTGPAVSTTYAEWSEVIHDNLTAAHLICSAAYPGLKATRGNVVLLGSIRGLDGGASTSGPAYAAAKAGILGLGRYLAREWAPDRIRVNVVMPGAVDTPMLQRLTPEQHERLKGRIPLGQYASSEEIASAVAFLASEYGGSMTGSYMNISNGEWIG